MAATTEGWQGLQRQVLGAGAATAADADGGRGHGTVAAAPLRAASAAGRMHTAQSALHSSYAQCDPGYQRFRSQAWLAGWLAARCPCCVGCGCALRAARCALRAARCVGRPASACMRVCGTSEHAGRHARSEDPLDSYLDSSSTYIQPAGRTRSAQWAVL